MFGFSDGNVGILGGYTTPDGTWLAVRPAQGPPDDGPKPMGEEAAICLAAQNDAGTWGLQPEVSTSVGPASSSWSTASRISDCAV